MSPSNRRTSAARRALRFSGAGFWVRPAAQRGQAILEFMVAALVLIPLFLLMPLIGKYLDIKQATIAASRKLAFECTVRYADCSNLTANPSFADEIRMGFFAGDASPVLTNDYPAQDAIGAGQGNPLWVDNQGRSLLENYSNVGVEADAKNVNVGGSLVSDLFDVGPGTFGLDLEKGLFDARVQANLSPTHGGANFLTQLDSMILKMQFHTAILTNAWTASQPGAQGDKCQPDTNTVIGRVSQVALCLAPYKVADAAYLPASDFVLPIAGVFEKNVGSFEFHNFMTPTWVDSVPTTDSVGYQRLQ
jgi:hypothetical protein